MTDRNSDDQQIKVTDKRMFTPDGELREEYRDLGKDLGSGVGQDPGQTRPPEPTRSVQPPPAGGSPIASPGSAQGAAPASAPSAAPKSPAADAKGAKPEATEYPSGAQFEDLVALLAQTTVTFLQQASSPRARSESLEQAQLYLDLLGILDDKTRGNLAPGEKAMLQDALRQLRLAFAQRG